MLGDERRDVWRGAGEMLQLHVDRGGAPRLDQLGQRGIRVIAGLAAEHAAERNHFDRVVLSPGIDPAVPLERRFQSGRPLDARQRRALELLANGLTPAAVAREIGTARETVGAWKNHHPEFVAALARRAV